MVEGGFAIIMQAVAVQVGDSADGRRSRIGGSLVEEDGAKCADRLQLEAVFRWALKDSIPISMLTHRQVRARRTLTLVFL